MSDLMTTNQAAEALRVSRQRVVQLIRRGRIPAEKLGQIWTIRHADVQAFRPRPNGYPKGRPRRATP